LTVLRAHYTSSLVPGAVVHANAALSYLQAKTDVE
jgi:hypothetical protein